MQLIKVTQTPHEVHLAKEAWRGNALSHFRDRGEMPSG